MSHMSVPCHEGPPATKGHFPSEPAVAGRGRYYCIVIFVNSLTRVPLATTDDILWLADEFGESLEFANKRKGGLLPGWRCRL